MTSDRPALQSPCPADRRGDDTHWWKAYQAHASVVETPPPVEQNPATYATDENEKICDGTRTATQTPA